MASMHKVSGTGNWVIWFRYGGKQFNTSSQTTNEKLAQRVKTRIEETLDDLKRGRLAMPADAEPATFIVSGGKLSEKPKVVTSELTGLREIADAYLADQHGKAKNTITGEAIHARHLCKILGDKTPLKKVGVKELQGYVKKRIAAGKAGRTAKKELVTFSQIWRWASKHEYVQAGCPLLGENRKWAIEIPKTAERQPFSTWEAIESRIARGGLSDEQKSKLWKTLFLDKQQVDGLLEHVRETARYPFVYPMFCFVAYTGARRSEMCRARIDDFDFENKTVQIREMKRKKKFSESSRFVDLHPTLIKVLTEWFANHPGGQYAFAMPLAMPRRRRKTEFTQLTDSEAAKHFSTALDGSKWSVVRGWHVLRHSFGANYLRAGASREQIAKWMGHSTQEMADLYQHLFPKDGQSQIALLG